MPLSPDVLKDSRLKVDWARKKIDEFNEVARVFFDKQPYVESRELDAQTQQISIKTRLREPLPIDLLRLTIECIQHLASALDQMVYTLALRNGVKLESGGFPFIKNGGAAELNTRLQNGPERAVGPQAIAIFRAAQPYQAGNPVLWSLYRLNNIDKHRHMIPVALGHLYYTIDNLTLAQVHAGQRVEIGRNIDGQTLETGIEIMRYPAGMNPEPKPEYTISPSVTFSNVLTEVNGKTINNVLVAFNNEVVRIIEAIEASCS